MTKREMHYHLFKSIGKLHERSSVRKKFKYLLHRKKPTGICIDITKIKEVC